MFAKDIQDLEDNSLSTSKILFLQDLFSLWTMHVMYLLNIAEKIDKKAAL